MLTAPPPLPLFLLPTCEGAIFASFFLFGLLSFMIDMGGSTYCPIYLFVSCVFCVTQVHMWIKSRCMGTPLSQGFVTTPLGLSSMFLHYYKYLAMWLNIMLGKGPMEEKWFNWGLSNKEESVSRKIAQGELTLANKEAMIECTIDILCGKWYGYIWGFVSPDLLLWCWDERTSCLLMIRISLCIILHYYPQGILFSLFTNYTIQ